MSRRAWGQTMNNEAIGIGGVFAFTIFLFLLRFLYLSLRRRDRSHYVTPTTFPEEHELYEKTAGDDVWLVMPPSRRSL